MQNKLITDDLESLITQNYPLVCLTETFINSTDLEDHLNDINTINGYKLIHKPRLNFKRPSGGIALAIRQDITKYVKCVENKCEYFLWFRLDKCLLSTDDDVFLGCI